MNWLLRLLCFCLLLWGGAGLAQDADSYANVYSAPGASADLPPNLTIAKGLPPLREAGMEAAKRTWESYRTPTPAKKLIPVRAVKRPALSAVPATAQPASR